MRTYKVVVGIMLFLILLSLTGCGPEATPAPTEAPTSAAPPAADAGAALTVAGKAFTIADLEAMELVEVDADGQARAGVSILALLSAAGAADVEVITLVGRDGYSAKVVVADLDGESILAFGESGVLDTLIPGQGKGTWVRDTVAIETGTGAAQPAAEAEPTSLPPADTIFAANGKPFTMADLLAMEQVEIDVDDRHYTGVRLLDVLAAAGIAEGSIRLMASDGYEGQVGLDVLDEQSLLAYNDEGGVNTVLPGYDKGSWVKYVIRIEPLGAPESAGPLPTVRPLGGETVTVVDSLGNEVLIPAGVQSVASMRSGITEIICALGECDKIVAVDEMVKDGTSYGEFVTRVHPELMELPAPYAGRDLSVEEILRIGPDLVLHGGYGRIKQAEALMKQAPGLPVVIAHFETIEQYMDDIRIVAQCIDAEERAEALIVYLQGELDEITARVDDVPEGEKVRVFYGGHEIDHGYTPDTFEHAQIVLAGGVNVAQELSGWLPDVSPEQLLVWDPEVIVVLNGADVEAILNDPQVASVSAIKNGRVHALPEAGWDFSSPRALFAIQWLATKLYPERFADVDIEAAADEFYQAVFGADYDGPPLED
ncbi:MAG: ABC transporter substrate-binding protein [Anaerolineae bacterium]|nr:ABC transporter substrate-binding protein [Anaerolineae bacterium]